MKQYIWRAVVVLALGAGAVHAQGQVSGPFGFTEAPALPQPAAQQGFRLVQQVPGPPPMEKPEKLPQPMDVRPEQVPAPREVAPEQLPAPAEGAPAPEEAPVLLVSKPANAVMPCGDCRPKVSACRKVWEWLTYRPLSGSCLCDCCKPCKPCGLPPLYIFFLCDKYNYPPTPYGCGNCGGGCGGH